MTAPEKVTFRLSIQGYEEGVMYDSFADGGFQSFDQADVRIIGGPRVGERRSIMVDSQDVREVAVWNQPGRELTVRVRPEALERGDVVFSTAFTVETDEEPGEHPDG